MALNAGQTDGVTELAGEATVDSPPSERDSDDGENGLEADDDSISFPGTVFHIDEPVGVASPEE